MKTYRIEMMDRESYHEMMTGGYNYSVKYINVDAETPEMALAYAEKHYGDYVINKDYIRTVEELEAEQKARQEAWEAARKAAEEKKAKAKARKIEREKAKADELGLTVEEYRAKVKHNKKVREAEERIEWLKAELIKAEKNLKNLQKGA